MTLRTTALALALLAAAPIAMAGTANDAFQVTMTLENSCTINANDLNFGTQDTLEANIDAQTTVEVACTGVSPLTLSFDNGAGAGATAAARKLSNGGNTIDYVLTRDAGRTELLGTGANDIQALATGAPQVFPVFGRVVGGQNPKAVGQYLDTVTATVAF